MWPEVLFLRPTAPPGRLSWETFCPVSEAARQLNFFSRGFCGGRPPLPVFIYHGNCRESFIIMTGSHFIFRGAIFGQTSGRNLITRRSRDPATRSPIYYTWNETWGRLRTHRCHPWRPMMHERAEDDMMEDTRCIETSTRDITAFTPRYIPYKLSRTMQS